MVDLTERLRAQLDNLPTNPNPPPEEDDEQVEALERYMDMARNRLVLITTEMALGDIPLEQWLDLFEIELRYLTLMAAALAAGGFDGLTRDMMARADAALREQLVYLQEWYRAMSPDLNVLRRPDGQLERPDDGLFDRTIKQIVARAVLYIGGAWAVYEIVRGQALGLPPMPFYPAVGTQCHTNCRCRWMYVKIAGDGNWDCYWRRSPVDSCDTCRTRERVASPLRVRAGRILPFDTAGTVV